MPEDPPLLSTAICTSTGGGEAISGHRHQGLAGELSVGATACRCSHHTLPVLLQIMISWRSFAPGENLVIAFCEQAPIVPASLHRPVWRETMCGVTDCGCLCLLLLIRRRVTAVRKTAHSRGEVYALAGDH